jgi:hypothetical protein
MGKDTLNSLDGIMSTTTMDPSANNDDDATKSGITRAPLSSITDLIPFEVLREILITFLGPGHYRYVAGTCRTFRNAHKNNNDAISTTVTTTTWESAAACVSCAKLCLKEVNYYHLHDIAWEAARTGQMDVIQWTCTQGYCFEKRLFEQAALCGQLKVLEWAHDKNIVWDYAFVADCAASAGHVKVLEWMRMHGTETTTTRRTCRREDSSLVFNCSKTAARGGHVSVLEWMKQHGMPIRHVGVCWREAAIRGHVLVLNWLLDNGHSLDPKVMNIAAIFGQITVMQWALENKVGWSIQTSALAAYSGQWNALKWLQSKECPWDGSVMYWAKNQGHSDICEWARTNGCPTEAQRFYTLIELFQI